MGVAPDGGAIGETERWFLRRGLPHLIEDYSPTRDVLTRTVPLLTLIFLAEVVNAPKASFPLWLSVVAVVVGFCILLGAWALANAVRHRPLLARPAEVGPFEIAVFVIAPALLPLVFGVQWRSAAVTAGVNIALLGVIYLGASYGVVPMTRWAALQLATQLGAVIGLLVRALPLVLLFTTFLFVNTEVWQVSSDLPWATLALVMGLFFLLGTVFAAIRLPRQIGELATFDSWATIAERIRGTPAERLDPGDAEPPEQIPRLSRRQWGNVGLVVLFAEGVQVALVTMLVAGFFVLFGFLAISPAVIESWLGTAPETHATLDWFDHRMVLTRELLEVAAFLGTFTGLYFTVFLLTDATYREEFLDEVVDQVRDAFAVRAEYLAARAAPVSR